VNPAEPHAVRRPGRPRDARAGEAILVAAAEVLGEGGPQGFTVEAVAARAGVGKATIYRRWPTRGELMLDAASRVGLEVTPVDTGNVRDDLVQHLVALADKMAGTPSGRLLVAIIAEAVANPEMNQQLRAFTMARRQVARAAVVRGMERGQLPPDIDPDDVLDLLGGPIFWRLLTGGMVADAAFITWMVDTVLAGVRAGVAPGQATGPAATPAG
jgi:AcrR family transcriptional regulator